MALEPLPHLGVAVLPLKRRRVPVERIEDSPIRVLVNAGRQQPPGIPSDARYPVHVVPRDGDVAHRVKDSFRQPGRHVTIEVRRHRPRPHRGAVNPYGDAPARLQQPGELIERRPRTRRVVQHSDAEYEVESLVAERQSEDISLREMYVWTILQVA